MQTGLLQMKNRRVGIPPGWGRAKGRIEPGVGLASGQPESHEDRAI
jgi:hypothetical protein